MRITRDMLADLREEVVVMMGHAPVPDWMAFDLTVGYVEVLDHGSSWTTSVARQYRIPTRRVAGPVSVWYDQHCYDEATLLVLAKMRM